MPPAKNDILLHVLFETDRVDLLAERNSLGEQSLMRLKLISRPNKISCSNRSSHFCRDRGNGKRPFSSMDTIPICHESRLYHLLPCYCKTELPLHAKAMQHTPLSPFIKILLVKYWGRPSLVILNVLI